MQNRLNIRILHIALLFLLSVGCLLPHAAYATPLQDDLIAIRTAMQAELASDRDYGEMNRQAKTFEERLAILRLQQAEAESIVRHLRQIKMHSKEGRVIRDKMAGSFEKISKYYDRRHHGQTGRYPRLFHYGGKYENSQPRNDCRYARICRTRGKTRCRKQQMMPPIKTGRLKTRFQVSDGLP